MKKILFAVVVIAALMVGTTSCNLDKKRCYKLTVTYIENGETKQAVGYKWGSIAEIGTSDFAESFLKSLLLIPSDADIKSRFYEQARKYKTEADCNAQNPTK